MIIKPKMKLQDKKECFVCKKTTGLHKHHVYMGSNRKWSEKYGCTVWLCYEHHEGDSGVHKDYKLCRWLQNLVREKFLEYYDADLSEFIQIFGKSYIYEEN